MVAVEEVLLIEKTVKADPRFQEALRRRGLLAEVDNMCIDPWTVGEFGYEVEQGRRVLNCFVWMRTFPLDNYYAHPVEGLHALIDLSTLEILRVDDHFEAAGDYVPVPRTPLNFDADVLTEFRRAVRAARRGAAGRPRLSRGGQPGHLGELGFPRRLQRPRGPGAPHDRLHPSGTAAAGACIAPRSPRWSCRTARRSAAITGRTCSTAARSASAGWPIR